MGVAFNLQVNQKMLVFAHFFYTCNTDYSFIALEILNNDCTWQTLLKSEFRCQHMANIYDLSGNSV